MFTRCSRSQVCHSLAQLFEDTKDGEYAALWTKVCKGEAVAWREAVRMRVRDGCNAMAIAAIAVKHAPVAAASLVALWEPTCPPKPPSPPATLHNGGVVFDEDYDEPAMRPYDLMGRNIIVVRANMGAGKKEAFVAALKLLAEDVTVLVITHSVTLSRKIHKELDGLGFHLYLRETPESKPRALDDPDGGPDAAAAPAPYMMSQNRIVCCLDSLHRVNAKYFDVVVCDEVLSTLQRFNAPEPMMGGPDGRRTVVCQTFRWVADFARVV